MISRRIIFLYGFTLMPFWAFVFKKFLGMGVEYIFSAISYMMVIDLLVRIVINKKKILFPPYLIVGFIATAYISLADISIGEFHRYKEISVLKYLITSPYITAFNYMLVIENMSFTTSFMRKLVIVLSITIFVAALVTFIQIFDPTFFLYVNPDFAEEFQWRYSGRRYSIYSWLAYLSVGMSFVPILCVVYSLKLINGRKTWDILLAGALVCFLTLSRWVMLNYLVAALQNVIIRKKFLTSVFKYIFYTVIGLVASYYILSALGMDIDAIIQERLMDDSANTRFFAFEMFIKHFPQHPILGTGGVMTPELLTDLAGHSFQIHVGLLSLFYYYGLLGGGIYIFFIALLMIQLRRVAIKTKFWGSFFALLTFVAANFTLVEIDLCQHGILLALVFNSYFKQKLRIDENSNKTSVVSTNRSQRIAMRT